MTPHCRTRGFAAALAAILVGPVLAQTTSSTSTSTGTNTSGTRTTTPGTINTTGSTTSNTPPPPPPIRLSGRVMVDDGTPPEFPASIERVCNGNPYTEGYTDGKGYFSIQLGQNAGVIQDASEGGAPSNRTALGIPSTSTSNSGIGANSTNRPGGIDSRLSGCELRARLGGYRSSTIELSGRTSMDNPEVGTILLHHMGATESATTVTATTLRAPKEARRALQKGLDFVKKNKSEEAMASFQEAVKVDPEFAYAWFELGKLQLENGHIADGHESFEAAAKAEPRWPEPFMQLAVMAVKAHDWREVAENSDRVVHLNSYEYPQAYFLNGAANFNMHHLDVAQKSLEAAEKLDILHVFPQIHQLLGIIYAGDRRFAEAARELRSYVTLMPNAEDAPAVRQQLGAMERMAAAIPPPSPKDQQ